MVDAVRHRGPDDDGHYESADQGVALGMTRLSIVDIEGGHQPMFDERGRYALVFNGEIYNFRELWKDLVGLGHRFASDHSDTEVIVHGFEEWGTDVFRRLNGMFAIAIWDRDLAQLTLARDRAGEKPLYLGILSGGGCVFGSELKALLLHPDLDRSIDLESLEEFLAFDFVVSPRTQLRSVSKLRAGWFAVISRDASDFRPYWSPQQMSVSRSRNEVRDELDRLLATSVAMRMVADVPVGLFLSGGLDSTSVGWYMAQAGERVRAFSIAFEDPAFDESREARFAADHLGVELEIHMFTQEQVADLIPRVTDLLDDPMGDQSVFPTYLLSVVARNAVKVALGGDGSDELFMGYRTYQALKVAWMLDRIPVVRNLARFVGARAPAGKGTLGRIGRFGRTLELEPEARLLSRLGSFQGLSRGVLAAPVRDRLGETAMTRAVREIQRDLPAGSGAAERTIGTYFRAYLQEDILVKVDRASMATSLEVRSPFLDPAIIDFALSVPPDMKLRGMSRKQPLKDVMRGRIPDQIIDRPKRGFGVPLNAWMRGALAPMVRDYLADSRISAAGIFDADAVNGIVGRHAAGDDVAGHQVWLLLQFELWRERWLNNFSPARTA